MLLPEGKVLIFDMEARPTAWIGGDYVGRSSTAFAYSFLNEDTVAVDAILPGEGAQQYWEDMVLRLVFAVERSDVVVGHYIRGFDLPLLNSDLERIGQPSLGRTLAVDTKTDRLQGNGLSESLENLMARYDLESEKMAMHEPWWEEFNLWQTPRSRARVMERVTSDVIGTKELYRALLDVDRLKVPSAWDPAKSKLPHYRS